MRGVLRAAGLRVLVLERAVFPRDKVCGDCLNPDAWPVLARLGLEDAVRALPHTALRAVEFVGLRGRPIRLPLPDDRRAGKSPSSAATWTRCCWTAPPRSARPCGRAGPSAACGAWPERRAG